MLRATAAASEADEDEDDESDFYVMKRADSGGGGVGRVRAGCKSTRYPLFSLPPLPDVCRQGWRV